MKHLRSLRAFIGELEAIGELQPIAREVDSTLEIGAVIRRAMELRAPAPLFETIAGYQPGYRVLGAPGALSAQGGRELARIALALGLPADASGRLIIESLAAARTRPGIKPRTVAREDASCKQNVLLGDEVDLLRFPTPLIHEGDGGRYIQTWGMNIVTTPDGAWTNASVNRMMLLDRNRLACLIPPNQHLGLIHAQWRERGEPTPVAVALGVEPGLPFAGGMPIPQGEDELDFLGAYFGEPLDVVPCETVDLRVPATAEIVIEGHISHTDTEMEGPMIEYPGYLSREASPKPVLHVSAVTYRNDPILPVVVAGPPVEENHTGWGLPHAAEVLVTLRAAGLPAAMCWMVLESANHWLVVAVDTDWHESTGMSSREISQRVGDVVFGSKAGFGIPRILLVENDVDITDVNEVVFAFGSRAHPAHGEILFTDEATATLPVFLDPSEKFSYRGTKVVHNCLMADRFPSKERPVIGDFTRAWPPRVQQRVLDHWHDYGYPAQGGQA
jgi:4-hydroxy-3-polyprenylbenzoate decarboxylase